MVDSTLAKLLTACHLPVKQAPNTNTKRRGRVRVLRCVQFRHFDLPSDDLEYIQYQVVTELRRVQNLIHAPHEECAYLGR